MSVSVVGKAAALFARECLNQENDAQRHREIDLRRRRRDACPGEGRFGYDGAHRGSLVATA